MASFSGLRTRLSDEQLCMHLFWPYPFVSPHQSGCYWELFISYLLLHCYRFTAPLCQNKKKKKKSAGFISLRAFLYRSLCRLFSGWSKAVLRRRLGNHVCLLKFAPTIQSQRRGDEIPFHTLPGIIPDLRLPAFRNVVITILGIFVVDEDIPPHWLPSEKCPPVPCLVGSSSREHWPT